MIAVPWVKVFAVICVGANFTDYSFDTDPGDCYDLPPGSQGSITVTLWQMISRKITLASAMCLALARVLWASSDCDLEEKSATVIQEYLKSRRELAGPTASTRILACDPVNEKGFRKVYVAIEMPDVVRVIGLFISTNQDMWLLA